MRAVRTRITTFLLERKGDCSLTFDSIVVHCGDGYVVLIVVLQVAHRVGVGGSVRRQCRHWYVFRCVVHLIKIPFPLLMLASVQITVQSPKIWLVRGLVEFVPAR